MRRPFAAPSSALNTACIDKSLGKTTAPALAAPALNWGCIPSKALLDASHKFVEAQQHFAELGIKVGKLEPLMCRQMLARKDEVVKGLTGGIAGLFKGNGVTSCRARASCSAAHKVQFTDHERQRARCLLRRARHSRAGFRARRDSAGTAAFRRGHRRLHRRAGVRQAVPKTLGVIGAGVIGLELGSVWSGWVRRWWCWKRWKNSCPWPTSALPGMPRKS